MHNPASCAVATTSNEMGRFVLTWLLRGQSRSAGWRESPRRTAPLSGEASSSPRAHARTEFEPCRPSPAPGAASSRQPAASDPASPPVYTRRLRALWTITPNPSLLLTQPYSPARVAQGASSTALATPELEPLHAGCCWVTAYHASSLHCASARSLRLESHRS